MVLRMFEVMERDQLVKWFHILLRKGGIDRCGKLSLLGRYGVSSSKALCPEALRELCSELYERLGVGREWQEVCRWRERLRCVIREYMSLTGRDADDGYVEGIACRAARCKRFDRIPLRRLQNVYYEFRRRADDARCVGEVSVHARFAGLSSVQRAGLN